MSQIPARPGEPAVPPRADGGGLSQELAGLSRALFEQSPFSTVLYDHTGRLLALNASFERLWGLRMADIPGDYNVLRDPQLERQGVLPLVARAFAGEPVVTPPVRYEAARLGESGRTTWTQGHWYPLRDDAGRVTHVVLAHVDLTARIEAETALEARNRDYEEQVEEAQSLNEELEQANEQLYEALAAAQRSAERLRESESRHRALVESTTLMVWTTDANGYVEDMPFWRALTGQTREQVRGDGWQSAIHPGDRDRVARIWRAAHLARAIYEVEYRLRLKDGTFRWFRARGVPVIENGAVREWIGVFDDVDDQRRARAAQALLESVSIALSRIVSADEALRMLARLVVEPAGADDEPFADGAAVLLARPNDRPRLVAVESVDPRRRELVERMERDYPRAPDAPAGYSAVMRTGAPELRPDVDTSLLARVVREPGHLELLREIDLYSSIIVPLRARGETVGAISLALHGPGRRRRFDARDLAVAEELARRASTALENARRFESEQRAAERARSLQALAAALVNATTVREVSEAILEQAMRALGADAATLAVLHETPDGAEFETLHSRGYPDAVMQRFARFPVAPGRPLSDAIVGRQPVLIRSRAEWEQRYPDMRASTTDLTFEALALVPVISKGRPLAGISFSFREPRDFDEGALTFLATLGEQCGLAMERARAFQAEQRAREHSAFLADASRRLSASLDLESTMRGLVESAVPRLGDWCAVDVVRDPGSGTWPPALDRIAILHRDPAMMELARQLEERYPTDWSVDVGRAHVLRTGEPLFVPAVPDAMLAASARDESHLALLRRLGFTSIIVVPLRTRGLTLGTLTLATSESRRRYDGADLALALDLAQRAAAAVDNARLFRDAERARLDAEEANRAKSEFLATMSHELRTPLNAIDGYAQLLEMGVRGELTAEQSADIARIRRSQKHLLSLINDVLDFARVESGRLEFDLQRRALAPVLANLEYVIAPLLREKALRFVHRPPPPDLLVIADGEKLGQVVLNLLGNAVKFTDEGEIVLETDADDSHVHVRVRDTGRGIPEAMLEAVFEPFVQVDGGLRRTAQGSGLGLAIARDFARRMHGDVTVESREGEGSAFTLTLPRG